MVYNCTIHNSIDDVDPGEWDHLLKPEGDPFMDRRFVRAVERTMSDRARFWSVVIRDDDHRPVGSACLYYYPLDLTLLCSGRLKKVAGWVRRVFPRLLRVKLMICGLPVATGQSHLRFAPDADVADVLSCVDEALCRLARQNGTRRVLYREFDARECEQLGRLEELGYARGETPPMHHARAGYRDFDEFCANVKSNKRRLIKQSRAKFAKSNLRVVHRNGHDGIDRIYTDDVHRLYDAVLDGKATVELIPAEFFRELARQMPDEAAFTFIEDESRVVAFAASLCTKSAYQQLYVGFDYALNPSCDLYFNLFFNAVDYALRQNVADIFLGQTSDTFKTQKLCAYQVPMFFYRRGVFT